MASRIPCRHTNTALKCASTSTRRQSSSLAVKVSPFRELDSHLQDLHTSLHKKVASIRTLFSAPKNHEIDDSCHTGPGVCLDSTLLLTSARVVGRVATVRESGAASPLYKAYIGSSAALMYDSKEAVKVAPVAVSFASDVAVLKVVEREGMEYSIPGCPVAECPPEKESILMAMIFDNEEGWGISVANVRAAGQKTIMAKAPWPLDVVGVASWVLRDDPASFSVGYAAPLSSILPVIDYAKSKGADDPVVMDKWIHTAGDRSIYYP